MIRRVPSRQRPSAGVLQRLAVRVTAHVQEQDRASARRQCDDAEIGSAGAADDDVGTDPNGLTTTAANDNTPPLAATGTTTTSSSQQSRNLARTFASTMCSIAQIHSSHLL